MKTQPKIIDNRIGYFVFACLMAMATPAFAGPLTGAVTYIEGNVVTDIETLAIIGLAVTLFAMQIRWQLIIGICAGVWCLANPTAIQNAIAGGGG